MLTRDMFPRREDLVVCFAHPAYRMKATFEALNTGIQNFEVRDSADLDRRIGEADVVLASEMWHNGLIPIASRLRFIQSISSGTDRYDTVTLAERGVRLASAAGVNAQAVAEHAIGMILALTRRLAEARDNQARAHWRGMIGDPSVREDELDGKTLAIIGLGRIGQRLARLAKAFDMSVMGFRRDLSLGACDADSVHSISALKELLPRADFVALTCPLTPETARVINADTLGAMKRSAYLINVARGGCVDEPALLSALNDRRIAGAALDCTDPEPPPANSPLWTMPNVFLTPHSGGETPRYEARVIELLMENLERLWRGEAELRNQIV
jgi:phosphoglycerate dehydrogenase-like enzyme